MIPATEFSKAISTTAEAYKKHQVNKVLARVDEKLKEAIATMQRANAKPITEVYVVTQGDETRKTFEAVQKELQHLGFTAILADTPAYDDGPNRSSAAYTSLTVTVE